MSRRWLKDDVNIYVLHGMEFARDAWTLSAYVINNMKNQLLEFLLLLSSKNW